MNIEVLRMGERLVRDDRATTHVALVARALGAKRIYMSGVNPDIIDTISKINITWGGSFEIKITDKWKSIIKDCKKRSMKIVHLTMYGENINKVSINEQDLLIIVGAEKIPREIYDIVDYNVAIGNQPHSEIGALAIFLDRLQVGKQFDNQFDNAQKRIIPTINGKNVVEN